MATLEDLRTGERHWLSPRHLLGRAPACQLRLDEPRISGVHAELIWDGRQWLVQDLGSRNGTAVGLHVLAAGERRPLERGAELVLAGRARLRLIDDSAPHLVASSPDGEVRIAADNLLLLPNDEQPELTVYHDADDWWVESDIGRSRANESETLFAGGKPWRLMLPSVVPETRGLDEALYLHDLLFRFHVSRDGEHVELTLVAAQREIVVEARAHLMLLLLLAHARLQDGQRDLPESECGWVYRDELPKQLAVESHMPNLWVHRARKQLASLGVRDSASLIDRRAKATQLRIGVRRLEVSSS